MCKNWELVDAGLVNKVVVTLEVVLGNMAIVELKTEVLVMVLIVMPLAVLV